MNPPSGDDRAFPIDLDAIVEGCISDRTLRNTLRFGIACEVKKLNAGGISEQLARKMALIQRLRESPLLVKSDDANRQHYEVCVDLFRVMLDTRLKYSCGLWATGAADLDAAQEAMLGLIVQRAEVRDGQSILDLGCGWGAMTFYIAERFSDCHIVSLTNSESQKQHIETEARRREISNVEVHRANVADWTPFSRFDRIISIEMFEHMRNFQLLFAKLSNWLNDGGRLFAHVFSHRHHAYLFEKSWMAMRFFSGGLMPSDDLFLHFQDDLQVQDRWCHDGTHYQRTAQAWLDRLDARPDEARAALRAEAGGIAVERLLVEWRLFLLACIEAFGHEGGHEWMISHYLMSKRP